METTDIQRIKRLISILLKTRYYTCYTKGHEFYFHNNEGSFSSAKYEEYYRMYTDIPSYISLYEEMTWWYDPGSCGDYLCGSCYCESVIERIIDDFLALSIEQRKAICAEYIEIEDYS